MAEVIHLMIDYPFDIRVGPSASAPGSLGEVVVTSKNADTKPYQPVPNTDCTSPQAEVLMLQRGSAATTGTVEARLSAAVVARTTPSARCEELLFP